MWFTRDCGIEWFRVDVEGWREPELGVRGGLSRATFYTVRGRTVLVLLQCSLF
jgi:hypothetical protein